MRIAYLDCFSGMSGDMFLGALVDVGVSPQLFQDTIAALNIGARLDISRVTRGGISATKVDVFVHGEKELPREVFWEQQGHTHEHAHAGSGHSHAHRNEPVQLREHNYARTVQSEGGKGESGSEVHEHGHSHGRGLSEIREIIAKASISDGAKKTATSIFDALGAAEAKIDNVGYGAGSRDFPGHANVVRLTVGEAPATHAPTISDELITILEATLDDLNPQLFGYVMDRVLQAGALDAYAIPVQMKKNRPGDRKSVVAKPEDAAQLTEIIFSETTTLGVRRRQEQRQALIRRWVNVPTRWGEVRMKLASMNGTVTNYAPEYEDCRRIAAEHHVPLKAVMQ